MTGVWYRFRAERRTRGRAWLGLALLVGLAAGAVMAPAAGARRTDSAYARFLDAHNAYDVMVINFPEDRTPVFDFDELARLPEVADSARAGFGYLPTMLTVSYLASQGRRIGTEINAIEIVEGRRADPRRADEAVVAFTFADEHGLEVRETLDIGTTAQPDEAVPGGRLRIVGIGAAPGEFPPQYQGALRPLVHVTPAFQRAVGADPDDEALLVRLHGGAAAVDGFLAALEARSGGLAPQVFVQRDHAAVVERSIHLQALALWLLAGLTAVTGALIVGQVLARVAHVEAGDHPTLAVLGMTPGERAALGLLRAAAIAAAGAALGVGVAVLASPLLPTGLARTAEPSPGWAADLLVLPVGAVVTVAVVVALSAWPAWRAARSATVEADDGPGLRLMPLARVLAGAPAPAGIGVRMALTPGRGGRAVPVRTTFGVVGLGIGALVAAVTFGASLSHLLATPHLYGVTWDAELVPLVKEDDRGAGHVDLLLADERVEGLAAGSASFGGVLDIEGGRVDALALDVLKGDMGPPILDGPRRPPARLHWVPARCGPWAPRSVTSSPSGPPGVRPAWTCAWSARRSSPPSARRRNSARARWPRSALGPCSTRSSQAAAGPTSSSG